MPSVNENGGDSFFLQNNMGLKFREPLYALHSYSATKDILAVYLLTHMTRGS